MYSGGWVETYLGLSSKVLRNYEKHGVIERHAERGNRAYDDDGVKKLMTARLLQGIGFTVHEVGCILNGGGAAALSRLQEKLEKLEAERRRLETLIGFAQMIYMTGSVPALPAPDPARGFDAYLEEVRREWADGSSVRRQMNVLADVAQGSEEAMENVQIDPMTLAVTETVDAILNCRKLGSAHPETLRHVARYHAMAQQVRRKIDVDAEEISPRNFARVMIRMYTGSGIGEIQRRTLGEENCAFMAEALAAYGGYERPEDAE